MIIPEQSDHQYPASYIDSRDLAAEVGYAEYPYRLTAQEAANNGLTEEATRLGYLANVTGVFAGKVYLSALEAQLEAGYGKETLATTPETLTPEEEAYKETILENLGVSHSSYASVVVAINSSEAGETDDARLEIATKAEAKVALEAILTPAMIRAEMAQIAEFTTNPEENSPEAGFDTLFIPNENLTAEAETALANHLQTKLTAYSGEAYIYEPLHNDATAHTATSSDAKVVAVRVPKHLNVRKGVVTSEKKAVQSQADAVNAHNNDPNTSYKLQMATDMEALSHIALLIDTNAIDATTPNHDGKRFWSTYYKNILQEPVDNYVSDVCVYDDGRLALDGSNVGLDYAARALVVPKA